MTKGGLLDLLRALAKSVTKACMEDVQTGADRVSIGEFHVGVDPDTQYQGSCWVA